LILQFIFQLFIYNDLLYFIRLQRLHLAHGWRRKTAHEKRIYGSSLIVSMPCSMGIVFREVVRPSTAELWKSDGLAIAGSGEK
jgi:hypothetical protein